MPSPLRRIRGVCAHVCAEKIPTGLYSLDGVSPTVDASAWVSPTAAVVGNVTLKENSSVWFGAVMRGDSATPIVVGRNSNIQDGD